MRATALCQESGQVDIVISAAEDSDFLVYGMRRVIYNLCQTAYFMRSMSSTTCSVRQSVVANSAAGRLRSSVSGVVNLMSRCVNLMSPRLLRPLLRFAAVASHPRSAVTLPTAFRITLSGCDPYESEL